VLIKTDEESLNIIKDAKGLFSHWYNYSRYGLEHEVGFDDQRLCDYELWASEGFTFRGVEKPLKVAHVKEKYPKEVKPEKQNRDFWVICSDETLSGMQLRELAHLRWRIENNGFRQLNQQANCDHVYTHEPHAFEALVLILFIGFNLFLLFSSELEALSLEGGLRDLIQEYSGVKWSLAFLSLLLFVSFIFEYHFDFDSASVGHQG